MSVLVKIGCPRAPLLVDIGTENQVHVIFSPRRRDGYDMRTKNQMHLIISPRAAAMVMRTKNQVLVVFYLPSCAAVGWIWGWEIST